MHKHECKSCKTAKEIINRYDAMILDNQEPSLEDMNKYNIAVEFYKNMMAGSSWKNYNKDVKGAMYVPEMMGRGLTESEAKKWVDNMYHETNTGEIIKGEKWDMMTTTDVLTENGVIFNNDLTPVEGYIALNMVWHDFYKSAYTAKMENEPAFYVSLAKDILIDDDSKHTPKEKMYIKHYLITHA